MVRVTSPPREQDAECLGLNTESKMGGVVLVTEISVSADNVRASASVSRVADVVRYKCRGRSTHLRLRMTTAPLPRTGLSYQPPFSAMTHYSSE